VEQGVHKQVVNRVIEPYSWVKTIVSSTSWDNFFWQRVSKQAQPEIYALAKAMYRAYKRSSPQPVHMGKWHLPYVDYNAEYSEAATYGQLLNLSVDSVLRMISVGRCARVSYLNHEGKRSIEDDVAVYQKMVDAIPVWHGSPFEHVAQPTYEPTERCGNFVGWQQLRQLLEEQKPLRPFTDADFLEETGEEV
jgi:hypothetical protein